MFCTFILGLLLGWVAWRYEGVSKRAMNSEVDFWRSNLEQCRGELGNEQNINAALRDQTATLKKHLSSLQGKADL
jgi:hypothetical protein